MTYAAGTAAGSARRRIVIRRNVLIAVGVIAAVALIAWGIDATARMEQRRQHARNIVCAEMGTASSDRLYADLTHLSYDDTRDVQTYAADLGQYGPNALITQRAFDTAVRNVCAS